MIIYLYNIGFDVTISGDMGYLKHVIAQKKNHAYDN